MDLVVYNWMSIALSVLNTVIMVFMAYKFMHTYQLNSYHLGRLFNWYGNTNGRYFKRLVLISLLSLAGLVVTNVLFSGYVHEIFTYLGLLFYFTISILFIKFESKIPKKKPLVFTKRMVRQYVVFAVLALASNFALFYLNRLIFNADEILKIFRFTFISISPLILPFIVLLSCFLTAPFELLNNYRYRQKAHKKLLAHTNLIKIAITGSYAKTTVKNILARFLSQKYKVLSTPESYNTPMGISRCVSKLKPSHEVFIAEMGARNIGNIKELCDMVRPDYGVITGISNQHLETFHSIDNIIKTKCELSDSLAASGGYLVVNGDTNHLDKLLSQIKCDYDLCGLEQNDKTIYAKNITVTPNGSEFDVVVGDEEHHCFTKMLGKHNISNIVLAMGIAIKLGVSMESIVNTIANLVPPSHRLELIKTPNGMTILDDTFNANQEGASSALKTLSLFEGRKVIVTPGLVELGREEKTSNELFGRQIAKVCDLAVLIGEKRSLPIRKGLIEEGFDEEKILVFNSLSEAKQEFKNFLTADDVLLLENDLPDDYNEIDELH